MSVLPFRSLSTHPIAVNEILPYFPGRHKSLPSLTYREPHEIPLILPGCPTTVTGPLPAHLHIISFFGSPRRVLSLKSKRKAVLSFQITIGIHIDPVSLLFWPERLLCLPSRCSPASAECQLNAPIAPLRLCRAKLPFTNSRRECSSPSPTRCRQPVSPRAARLLLRLHLSLALGINPHSHTSRHLLEELFSLRSQRL
jgi:hypothetical protein